MSLIELNKQSFAIVHAGSSRIWAAGALALTLSSPAMAADPADCFEDLMTGKGAEIACKFPLRPGPGEREELTKASRGYLQDVTCTVEIRIERAMITAAIETPDTIFQAPPQPVTCAVTATLTDKRGPTTFPISATFAPRVVIKDGKATTATPGLGQITGVSRALSWPVAYWVNHGSTIRTGMLQVVNAWLIHMRDRKAKGL